MIGDDMSRKTNLIRFDLLLPPVAVEIIEKEAATRAVSPRVMGRMLVVAKIKDVIGLDQNDVLPDITPAADAAFGDNTSAAGNTITPKGMVASTSTPTGGMFAHGTKR